MLTLKELAERRNVLMIEHDGVLNKDEPTDDEISRVEAIQEEVRDIDRKVKMLSDADGLRAFGNQPASQLPPPPDGEDIAPPEARFASFGEQLQAVAMADSGQGQDPRLRAISGASETVPSDGGYLVQQEFINSLLTPTWKTAVLAGKANRVPISNGNGIKIPAVNETSRADGSRWGGIRAYWVDEGGTATASKPKFRMIELDLKKLMAIFYATDELLADQTALGAVISQGFPEEMGFKLDDAVFNGDGAGKPQGILNSPALVSQAKETNQGAATVVAENIEKMYSRMTPRSLGAAEFYINQELWPQIFQLQHAVGTGGVSMFIPAGGISQAPFGTLLGRPIVPIEHAAALGTVGDIVFADMSQYILGEKGGIRSDVSMHVRFLYAEQTFRFIMRVDGQTIPNSALTPFKGSATQSPFVALATRS